MKMLFRVLIAVGVVAVVIGGLGVVKGLQIGRMIAHGENFVPPAQTVTVAEVDRLQWETSLTSVGSLEAVQGVTVRAELAGKVTQIAFEPGTKVNAGQLLVQQDISEEKARLRIAQSRAQLALKNLRRTRALHKENVVPDSDLDTNTAAYEQASAEVDNIKAIIEKKTVRAPFSGRLGIRQVNLGEVLEVGQAIVSLQSLDPIFVNFQLPQQEMSRLKTGLTVRLGLEPDNGTLIEGTVTALNPEVNQNSRNIRVQATVDNPDEHLKPGMYARVAVMLPAKRSVLTIPATAILYAPYSDSVFVVESKEGNGGKTSYMLRQQFVQLGERRGDFIAVNQGLQIGQQVVSTGVFKLRNGMQVTIDNSLAPEFELSPRPDNA